MVKHIGSVQFNTQGQNMYVGDKGEVTAGSHYKKEGTNKNKKRHIGVDKGIILEQEMNHRFF